MLIAEDLQYLLQHLISQDKLYHLLCRVRSQNLVESIHLYHDQLPVETSMQLKIEMKDHPD
jgi:hypothetical protein